MPDTPLPSWLLERLAQDELSPKLMKIAEQRLAAELEGRARLAALKSEDALFLETANVAQAVADIRRKAEAPKQTARAPRRSSRAVPWLLTATVGVASVTVISVVGLRTAHDDQGEETRIKGLAPKLEVYRRLDQGAEELEDGVTVKAGDQIQLEYAAAGKTFGAILSIDGRGKVTLHLPESQDASSEDLRLARSPTGAVPLPHAYALDDAPAFERFFFVTSTRPFDLKRVLSAAEALARRSGAAMEPLSLPPDLDQVGLLLRKGSP